MLGVTLCCCGSLNVPVDATSPAASAGTADAKGLLYLLPIRQDGTRYRVLKRSRMGGLFSWTLEMAVLHRETSNPHLTVSRGGLLPLFLMTVLAWLAIVGLILLFLVAT